jgi:crooked neck
MEERYGEHDRASAIYERWIAVRPEPRVWVKWAKFEEERGRVDKARQVFQTALEFFGDEEQQIEKAQAVFNAFAKMETRLKEYDRARVIYKVGFVDHTHFLALPFVGLTPSQFALDRVPRSKSVALYDAYTKFEKQHGTTTTLSSTVLGKRRIQYEEELAHDGRNYDVWFEYARLEEGALLEVRDIGGSMDGGEDEQKAVERVRELYERAVAQVPPGAEKRHWRRYIYLWLNYALFEEIETKVGTCVFLPLPIRLTRQQDFQRARQIYQTALSLVPHKQFTFAKLWLQSAQFEVRRLDLPAARKLLGAAIGMCPKEKLFKGYIQFEFDVSDSPTRKFITSHIFQYSSANSNASARCTKSTSRYVPPLSFPAPLFELLTLRAPIHKYDPSNSAAWIQYAELEAQLADYARARAIYELGVNQSPLSMPEILWRAYIRFEVNEGERDKVRSLYERLLKQSSHVKVWISYAKFEAGPIRVRREVREEDEDEDEEVESTWKMVPGQIERAREVFEQGYKDLKSQGLKTEVFCPFALFSCVHFTDSAHRSAWPC